MVGLGFKNRPFPTPAIDPNDPMAATFGYVPRPGPNAGLGDTWRYLNQTSPDALMALAAGISEGSFGKGLLGAALATRAGMQEQQQAKRDLYAYQDQTRRENMTRQWLIRQGLSEADADAAMANPAILSHLMAAPEKGTNDMQDYQK